MSEDNPLDGLVPAHERFNADQDFHVRVVEASARTGFTRTFVAWVLNVDDDTRERLSVAARQGEG